MSFLLRNHVFFALSLAICLALVFILIGEYPSRNDEALVYIFAGLILGLGLLFFRIWAGRIFILLSMYISAGAYIFAYPWGATNIASWICVASAISAILEVLFQIREYKSAKTD